MSTRPASPVPGLRISTKYFAWLTPILLALAAVVPSRGQAGTYTASHPLGLETFGTVGYVSPKYLYTSASAGTDFGLAAGVDLDVAAHLWVRPGMEIRATMATGGVSSQYTFGGGPRVMAPFEHVQPYVDFLFSGGRIDFTQHLDPNYLSDQSAVYSYGGGANFVVSRGWAVKVDVQSQRWRLTHLQPPFYPLQITVGLRYRAHGGKHSPE